MKNAKTLIKNQCGKTGQMLMRLLCCLFLFAGICEATYAAPAQSTHVNDRSVGGGEGHCKWNYN